MQQIKISIITINLNNEVGLIRTLSSVRLQSYENYEHIIIDGKSSDNSPIIISNYASNNSHVSYWVSEKDTGIYNAMNKGILRANGRYILFVNSGDFLESDILNKVDIYLTTEDLIYGNLYFISPNGDKKYYNFPEPFFEISDLFSSSFYLPHPATFIKSELIKKHLYSEHYKIISDWEFWLKAIIFEKCSLKHINLCISNFYLGGISSNIESVQKEKNQVFASLFPPQILQGLQYLVLMKNLPLYESMSQTINDRNFQIKANKCILFFYKFRLMFKSIFNNKC